MSTYIKLGFWNFIEDYADEKQEYSEESIKGLKCPSCNSEQLFTCTTEYRLVDDDVTKWFDKVSLKCAICGELIHIKDVCTKTKVDW